MDLLATARGRRVLFLTLYLSEGAPIGFLWWALPTLLRAGETPVPTITALTALLVLPWTFKWLWAPVVDVFSGPRFGLRSWILSAQLMMGFTLLPLTVLDPSVSIVALTGLLMVHAFAAATQDVAIDALAIRSVPEAERGRVNGWMQAGMLIGRGLFGGGSLLMVSRLGRVGTVALLVGVIWSAGALLLVSRERTITPGGVRVRDSIARVRNSLLSAARRKTTWAALAFAALAGAGFEAAGALAGPYLIDNDFTSEDVGLFFSLVSLPAMAAGALLGGWGADRYGKTRLTATGLLSIAAALGVLSLVDFMGFRSGVIPALAAVYLAIGVFTAASYSLFMMLTDRRLGATQFSAYMGATNLCESWSGFTGGRITGLAGYGAAFSIMGAVSLLALPLLRWMVPRHSSPSGPPPVDEACLPPGR